MIIAIMAMLIIVLLFGLVVVFVVLTLFTIALVIYVVNSCILRDSTPHCLSVGLLVGQMVGRILILFCFCGLCKIVEAHLASR